MVELKMILLRALFDWVAAIHRSFFVFLVRFC